MSTRSSKLTIHEAILTSLGDTRLATLEQVTVNVASRYSFYRPDEPLSDCVLKELTWLQSVWAVEALPFSEMGPIGFRLGAAIKARRG